MIKRISIATLAVSALFLQGCATLGVSKNTEFSCQNGDKKDISCLSASEVYNATNDKEYLNKNNINEQKKENNLEYKDKVIDANSSSFDSELSNYYNRKILSMGDAPVPIKTQQGVMRVWISPWVDKDDQLHTGEYVFKNITDSEWLVGAKVDLSSEFGGSKNRIYSKQKVEKRTAGNKRAVIDKKKGFDNAVDFMNRMK